MAGEDKWKYQNFDELTNADDRHEVYSGGEICFEI